MWSGKPIQYVNNLKFEILNEIVFNYFSLLINGTYIEFYEFEV